MTRGVNEVISTIMLNAIAVGIAAYLVRGPSPGTPRAGDTRPTPLPESARIPGFNGLLPARPAAADRAHGFLPLAVVVGVVVAFVVARTRFGFELRAAGLSPRRPSPRRPPAP